MLRLALCHHLCSSRQRRWPVAGWHVPSLAVALPQLVGATPADHGERLCAILWAGPLWGLEAFGDPRASHRVCPLRREHPRVWGAAFPRGFPLPVPGGEVGPGEGGGQPVPQERSLSGCKIQIELVFFFPPSSWFAGDSKQMRFF